jgi:hypothetical protein
MLPPSAQEIILLCLRVRALKLCKKDTLSLSTTCKRACAAIPRPPASYIFRTLLPRIARKRKRIPYEYVLEHCTFHERVQFVRYNGGHWGRKYPRLVARLR